MIGFGEAIQKIKTTENQLTLFFEQVAAMSHPENDCGLKFVWLSPQAGYASLAFPKKSPLYPFFMHFYTIMRETAEIDIITKNWGPVMPHCKSKVYEFKGISFSKIVLVISIFIGGLLIATGILGCEVFFQNIQKSLKN